MTQRQIQGQILKDVSIAAKPETRLLACLSGDQDERLSIDHAGPLVERG
jgi:hypothetical protein